MKAAVMRLIRVLVVVAAASLVGVPARADVRFSLRDGRVVIVATDASVAEILAEWASTGGTNIVNADQLVADRVTLELQNVTEGEALAILLRETSGYIARWRAAADPTASIFDRITIVRPSAAPPAADAGATAGSTRSPRNGGEPGSSDPPQQSPPAPVAEHANDAIDQPPPEGVTVGTDLRAAEAVQATFPSRRALEVANPRDFRLPASRPRDPTSGPTTTLRAGAVVR